MIVIRRGLIGGHPPHLSQEVPFPLNNSVPRNSVSYKFLAKTFVEKFYSFGSVICDGVKSNRRKSISSPGNIKTIGKHVHTPFLNRADMKKAVWLQTGGLDIHEFVVFAKSYSIFPRDVFSHYENLDPSTEMGHTGVTIDVNKYMNIFFSGECPVSLPHRGMKMMAPNECGSRKILMAAKRIRSYMGVSESHTCRQCIKRSRCKYYEKLIGEGKKGASGFDTNTERSGNQCTTEHFITGNNNGSADSNQTRSLPSPDTNHRNPINCTAADVGRVLFGFYQICKTFLEMPDVYPIEHYDRKASVMNIGSHILLSTRDNIEHIDKNSEEVEMHLFLNTHPFFSSAILILHLFSEFVQNKVKERGVMDIEIASPSITKALHIQEGKSRLEKVDPSSAISAKEAGIPLWMYLIMYPDKSKKGSRASSLSRRMSNDWNEHNEGDWVPEETPGLKDISTGPSEYLGDSGSEMNIGDDNNESRPGALFIDSLEDIPIPERFPGGFDTHSTLRLEYINRNITRYKRKYLLGIKDKSDAPKTIDLLSISENSSVEGNQIKLLHDNLLVNELPVGGYVNVESNSNKMTSINNDFASLLEEYNSIFEEGNRVTETMDNTDDGTGMETTNINYSNLMLQGTDSCKRRRQILLERMREIIAVDPHVLQGVTYFSLTTPTGNKYFKEENQFGEGSMGCTNQPLNNLYASASKLSELSPYLWNTTSSCHPTLEERDSLLKFLYRVPFRINENVWEPRESKNREPKFQIDQLQESELIESSNLLIDDETELANISIDEKINFWKTSIDSNEIPIERGAKRDKLFDIKDSNNNNNKDPNSTPGSNQVFDRDDREDMLFRSWELNQRTVTPVESRMEGFSSDSIGSNICPHRVEIVEEDETERRSSSSSVSKAPKYSVMGRLKFPSLDRFPGNTDGNIDGNKERRGLRRASRVLGTMTLLDPQVPKSSGESSQHSIDLNKSRKWNITKKNSTPTKDDTIKEIKRASIAMDTLFRKS